MTFLSMTDERNPHLNFLDFVMSTIDPEKDSDPEPIVDEGYDDTEDDFDDDDLYEDDDEDEYHSEKNYSY